MSGVEQKLVLESEVGLRLDRWFRSHYPALSHGQLQKLIRSGQIRVDGARVKSGQRLEAGQSVRIPPLGQQSTKKAAELDLSADEYEYVQKLVIYRDEHLIAINKPAGLAVQGGTKTIRHLDGLLEGLKFELNERPRLVHRLDKDTSGVLLLARTRVSANWLGEALRNKTVKKIYWTLVSGVPRQSQATISLPLIKKGERGRVRVRAAEPGESGAQLAVTHYAIMDKAAPHMAWLATMPVTGRTHQIRVHCAIIGHPIVGDGKYGGSLAHPVGEISTKLHLHSRSIEVPTPNGKTVKITAELPDHMENTWSLLEFDANMPEPQFPEGQHY